MEGNPALWSHPEEYTSFRKRMMASRWEQLNLMPSYTISYTVGEEDDEDRSYPPEIMTLDRTDQKYLLTASSRELCIYDMDKLGEAEDSNTALLRRSPLLRGIHHSLVDVSWLPLDNGLICSSHTSSSSGIIHIWDTSYLTIVEAIKVERSIFSHVVGDGHPSNSHRKFDLAVGGRDCVMLVDLRTGAAMQRLPSDRTRINCLLWGQNCDEWNLFGGGEDGSIKIWDIRRPNQIHKTCVLPSSSTRPRAIIKMAFVGSSSNSTICCHSQDAFLSLVDHHEGNIVWRSSLDHRSYADGSRFETISDTARPLVLLPNSSGLTAYNLLNGSREWFKPFVGTHKFDHVLYNPRRLELLGLALEKGAIDIFSL